MLAGTDLAKLRGFCNGSNPEVFADKGLAISPLCKKAEVLPRKNTFDTLSKVQTKKVAHQIKNGWATEGVQKIRNHK